MGPQEEEWEPTEKVQERKEEGLDHWKEWLKHGRRGGNPGRRGGKPGRRGAQVDLLRGRTKASYHIHNARVSASGNSGCVSADRANVNVFDRVLSLTRNRFIFFLWWPVKDGTQSKMAPSPDVHIGPIW